jgi:DNA-binding NarL/FixJ family response regulator
MPPIRVLILGSHALVRVGVRAVLGGLADVEVVGEAASGTTALGLVASLSPTVLLVDIVVGGMSGLEVAERVARDFPATRTLLLVMQSGTPHVARAIRAGAAGYLVQERGAEELPKAVRALARGECYPSPTASADLVRDVPRVELRDRLTPRQRDVLRLIADGQATKTIARRLDISVKTAETHRLQLMERLGIHQIAGLVRYAIRSGLVAVED